MGGGLSINSHVAFVAPLETTCRLRPLLAKYVRGTTRGAVVNWIGIRYRTVVVAFFIIILVFFVSIPLFPWWLCSWWA